jgi:hypothetical protein
MKVLQGRTNHDGLVHLNLRQFIAQPETVGKLAGLLGKSGDVRLEGFHVPSPQDAVQFAVEVGVSLLDFSIVNLHGSELYVNVVGVAAPEILRPEPVRGLRMTTLKIQMTKPQFVLATL